MTNAQSKTYDVFTKKEAIDFVMNQKGIDMENGGFKSWLLYPENNEITAKCSKDELLVINVCHHLKLHHHHKPKKIAFLI